MQHRTAAKPPLTNGRQYPEMPARPGASQTAELLTRPAKLLLTSVEAAESLSISPRTLWQLTKDGAVRALKCGKRGERYAPEDLAEYVRGLREAAGLSAG
jgi:hypothetical protein